MAESSWSFLPQSLEAWGTRYHWHDLLGLDQLLRERHREVRSGTRKSPRSFGREQVAAGVIVDVQRLQAAGDEEIARMPRGLGRGGLVEKIWS